MGNCSGLFANCNGEDVAPSAVRKIDTDAVAAAVRRNQQEQLDGNTMYGQNNMNGGYEQNTYGGGVGKENSYN